MKRILWIVLILLLAIGALCFVGRCFTVTTDYDAICTDCLQEESGLEKAFLGIRYYHEEKLVSGHERGRTILGEQRPPIDPHTYEQIFAKTCKHHFVRTGVGRSYLGVIGCGGATSPRVELRLALVEQLYQTFHRFPNRDLAQESYSLINKYCPDDIPPSAEPPKLQSPLEADALPDEPMSILLRGLPLVRSDGDWKAVMDAVKAGNGNIGLLNDRVLLIGRLKDVDVAAREQALHSLATRSDPESWEAIASVLDDPQIGSDAARQIIWNKHFEYFDRVMDIWQRPYDQGGVLEDKDALEQLAEELTDKEISNLFSQQKPRIDRLCFQAISARNRFACLEEVLTVLNQRPSPEAEQTIARLLAGPDPGLFRDDKTKKPAASQWQALQDMYPGKNPGYRNERTNAFLREAFQLGSSKRPEDWEAWRTIFEGWWQSHAAESYSAAFAEAMYAVDPDKTVKYLIAQLQGADDSWSKSATHILAAMGTIASPEFLPAIEEFKKRSVGTHYETNGYYSKYLDYATHRCRQIHLWKLVPNPDAPGKFMILRPDGTTMGSNK